ncbi:hypothetical protein [Planococcus sp. ISL-109]|uniref:hypothetical protein n=1 Tax=Planococcus sp. ISL-109 TaxID=2819166 RepID=UPI001BEBE1B5|nr:hypothetical protein [Planococcus sp. ISL-109]MBT2581212.1 hypothetical protein [Planococcus sp. ISL-109]
MNLFPSLATFVLVVAVVFPLYEGTTAIIIALVAGILAGVFVALGKQKQVQQTESQQQQLQQTMQQSTQSIVDSLASYQQQLTTNASDLAKQTNEQLMSVWSTTQQQLTEQTKQVVEKSTDLLSELTALQQQQDQLAKNTAQHLQQWLVEQSKVSTETFAAVQQTHQSLLQTTEQSNKQIESLWSEHQKKQLDIREQEQQTFNKMLAAVEEKEVAYTQHLNKQRDIFKNAQQQLKEALQEQAQLSHGALLTAWKEAAQQQLQLRQQEHAHIMDTQQTVTKLIDKNTTALNDKIIGGWETTRHALLDLRELEKEHSTSLFQSVEKANEAMSTTLVDQRETFATAQTFYANTYEEIKIYTGQLGTHEQALAAHHQQLIDTQHSIKDAIASTLNNTLDQYTNTLTASKESLVSGIQELKEQRAVSQKSFEEFLIVFLDGIESQEEKSTEFTEQLQSEITNLLDTSSSQLERAIILVSRASDSHSTTMNELLSDSKGVIEQNQHVLKSLNAHTEETKATAKALESAFKEMTTLNKKDMDILESLMR